ncbi:uncharacterized protein [Henckelia pumila]|uniref:uncharacterized protein n=1 Tax=Henckelia pumila TaxID=405737 RepID=UPI003C6E683B
MSSLEELRTYFFRSLLQIYVSELERRHVGPSVAQRHILAGLDSVVGRLSASYEKASHVNERPVVNWLLEAGFHPFGPFSNTSQISQLLQDAALRNIIYARDDYALHQIRDTSEFVQAFAAEHLKTSLGEPVKSKKNKSSTELWLEKFYKNMTNLPESFLHELVDRLEKYLNSLKEPLVYDHQLQDAHLISSQILHSSIFTQRYLEQFRQFMRKSQSYDSLLFDPKIEKTAKALRKARREELQQMAEKRERAVNNAPVPIRDHFRPVINTHYSGIARQNITANNFFS